MKALLSFLTLVLTFSAASQAQIVLTKQDLLTNSPATQQKVVGLKDFRVVIPGVLYRGGNSGGGAIPLKDIGLKALADMDFSTAVYMYPYAWAQKPANTYGINYSFISDTRNRAAQREYLMKIKDVIENRKGPLYVHCWNGWHASGEMASYALMQFCGFSNQEAQAYWNANVPKGDANKIMRMSRFQIFNDLRISAEDQARICPR